MWENAKRDKEAGESLGAMDGSSELLDIEENLTDRENRKFRYLL
jgi:hypothetical protein